MLLFPLFLFTVGMGDENGVGGEPPYKLLRTRPLILKTVEQGEGPGKRH